ncbi:hypothetical protein SH1V18_15260 [Vallitalea longa]|uniref:Uncharacterized protein n=1 Tax=Vallitalea longa TaxID=2936439 RepID=A0A9W5YAC8_9FIRM|nr:hypothetical protein [Vallitalea longa]GKX29046.1 hypothetical protein SH1V18_15260 [Vallitalea longa]
MKNIGSIVGYIVFILRRDEWTKEEVEGILSEVKEIMADPSKQPKYIKSKKHGNRFCQRR